MIPQSQLPETNGRSTGDRTKSHGFAVRITRRRFDNKSSDLTFSKLVSEIKVPSNVVSDTALRGLAAKLHTGDVLRGCQHRSAPLRKEGVSLRLT